MAKCNIYRLQDVFLYTGVFGERYEKHPDLAAARRALRDACVRVPRGVRTGVDLQKLAVAAGLKVGFDAYHGVFDE